MCKHGHVARRPSSPCAILCIEDDPLLGDLLLYALQREGYQARLAPTAGGGLQAITAEHPDLVLLDMHLPDGDGLALCGHIRLTHRLPVILTGANSDEDALAGFERGADDCVAKPFNMQILLYRIRAILRRAGSLEPFDMPKLRIGPGTFDPEHHELEGPEGRVKLTPIESGILTLLLSREGQVYPAERIIERVWSDEGKGTVTGVKTHMRRLRQKIAQAIGELEVIQTVPGLGYVLRQGPNISGRKTLRDTKTCNSISALVN